MPTNLSPLSTVSAVILPSSGDPADVASTLPFGIYSDSDQFLSGAADQVAYTYKKLGGDVVDIELTVGNVYASYEEAVLEYSNIINSHQAGNVLSDALGNTTGSFDSKGEITSGDSNLALKYPKFQISLARKIGDTLATEAGFGGTTPIYSASFAAVRGVQQYDLQEIVQSSSISGVDHNGNSVPFAGLIDGDRIFVTKVYYKSPRAMWRFYGYYGGLGVVGNASTYGQYADDATFEVVPAWQNKLQAIMYEDSLFTRTSHYSYEIVNNKIKIFPSPSGPDMQRMWFKFSIEGNTWEEDPNYSSGISGVNNVNTLPFDNLPYENINSMGKQWIRKYALALCKEMLGQIRGKFGAIPIPGNSVTLNSSDLLSQAKEEQTNLKDKLIEQLKTLGYGELMKQDGDFVEAAEKIFSNIPVPIFVG